MRHYVTILATLGTISSAPPPSSYIWSPRTLSCEYYGGNNTRCVLKYPGEVVERNPGCFEEINEFTGSTKVYCALGCEESDETTIAKKNPQHKRGCNVFYTYNLERRREDWYLWRSGKCINSTIEFEILCGTPTNPKEFYFKNEELFEYEDAKN